MNWFTSLPILVKIGLVLVGLVGLFLLVFFLMMVAYQRTDERTLAQLTCGSNRLVLVLVVRRYVGGTSTSHRLYWNDKPVSSTEDRDEAGQPRTLPADPDDLKGLVVKPITPSADGATWTVWVDPARFSRTDFNALTACLMEQQGEMARQIERAGGQKGYDAPIGGYAEAVQIGTLIYGDNRTVPDRRYTWKADWGETYELAVQPDGQVRLRHDYMTVYIGTVRFEAGKRRLRWRYNPDVLLLGPDLLRFKNERGQLLTERYTLEHAPDDNALFVRENGAYSERVLLYRPDAPAYEANTAVAVVINRKEPILNRFYNAGRVAPDTTGAGKPVFYWKPWPEHPLTEADLRTFQDERGRRLGDLYDLKSEPAD